MTMIELNPQDGDDRRFLEIVGRIVAVIPEAIRDIWIVRIDNWFDHKWLRFSGIGRVPFEHHRPSHPGVALDEFSQDQLTFPPFSPSRIVRQDLWTSGDTDGSADVVHPRVRQHSANNLHRRVAQFSDSMVAMWFSSRTEDNRQGSVMQYTSQNGILDAWYLSFRLQDSRWQVYRSKGLPRERAEAFMVDADPPSSVTQKR
jgi:hypothetical protein